MIFQGDVLLLSTSDGGNLSIKDNFVEGTGGFETAVFLSLAGGNVDDNGTESTRKKGWWGNALEPDNPNKRLVSRLQNIIRGLPTTPNNLNKAIQAAKDDLSWFIDEGIADTIEIDGSIPSKNRLELDIKILKDEKLLSEIRFEENWGAQKTNKFVVPVEAPASSTFKNLVTSSGKNLVTSRGRKLSAREIIGV